MYLRGRSVTILFCGVVNVIQSDLLDDWFVQDMGIVAYGIGVFGVVVYETERISFGD
jgi:hypothetical protein